MSAIDNYYAALDRLVRKRPERVRKGSAINKDTVALEAGRKRGSIRNRPEFSRLITDIEQASQKNSLTEKTNTGAEAKNMKRLRSKVEKMITDKDIAQSRYMSLLYQNYELKRQLIENDIEPRTLGSVLDIMID